MKKLKEFKAESFALSGKVLVEASAGSGKTYSLVVVYIRLLIEKGLAPAQIVILTYTRKAAEEITRRIRDHLQTIIAELKTKIDNLASSNSVNNNELSVAAKSDVFTSLLDRWCLSKGHDVTAIKDLIVRLKEADFNLENEMITTFHSFLLQLYETFAYTTKVPLRISINTSNTLYLAEVIEEFVTGTFYNAAINPYRLYFMAREIGAADFYKKLKPFWERSETHLLGGEERLPESDNYTALQSEYKTARNKLLQGYTDFLALCPLPIPIATPLDDAHLDRHVLKDKDKYFNDKRYDDWQRLIKTRDFFASEERISDKAKHFLKNMHQLGRILEQNTQLEIELALVIKFVVEFWNEAGAKGAFKGVLKDWTTEDMLENGISKCRAKALKGRSALVNSGSHEIDLAMESLVQTYSAYLWVLGRLQLHYDVVWRYFLTRILRETRVSVRERRLAKQMMTYEDLIMWALEMSSPPPLSISTDQATRLAAVSDKDSKATQSVKDIQRKQRQDQVNIARLLKEKYQAIMIDEFQDTNSKLYNIVQRYFAEIPLMVFIGDPKQSIFSFQGADLDGYIRMRSYIENLPDGHIYTLSTNYRSHPHLVNILNTLYQEIDDSKDPFLSNNKIEYSPMRASRSENETIPITKRSRDDKAGNVPAKNQARLTLWTFDETPKLKSDRHDAAAKLIVATLCRKWDAYNIEENQAPHLSNEALYNRAELDVKNDSAGNKETAAKPFWSQFAILVMRNDGDEGGRKLAQTLSAAKIPVRFIESERDKKLFKTSAPADMYQFLKAILLADDDPSAALTLQSKQTISRSQLNKRLYFSKVFMQKLRTEKSIDYHRRLLMTPLLKCDYMQYLVLGGSHFVLASIFSSYKTLWLREGFFAMLHTFLMTEIPDLVETSSDLTSLAAGETRTPLNNVLAHFKDADEALLYLQEFTELGYALAEDSKRLAPYPQELLLNLLSIVIEPEDDLAAGYLADLKEETQIEHFSVTHLSQRLNHMHHSPVSLADLNLVTTEDTPTRNPLRGEKQNPPSNDFSTKPSALKSPAAAIFPQPKHAYYSQGEEDVVRIYTIFGSKGLEFDTVFLPFLMETGFAIPDKVGLMEKPIKTSKSPTQCTTPHKLEHEETWFIDLLSSHPTLETIRGYESEKRRLLYVALTRAREHIFASVYKTSKATRKNVETSQSRPYKAQCAFSSLLGISHLTDADDSISTWFSHIPANLIEVKSADKMLLDIVLANSTASDRESGESITGARKAAKSHAKLPISALTTATTPSASFNAKLFSTWIPIKALSDLFKSNRRATGYSSSFTTLMRQQMVSRPDFLSASSVKNTNTPRTIQAPAQISLGEHERKKLRREQFLTELADNVTSHHSRYHNDDSQGERYYVDSLATEEDLAIEIEIEAERESEVNDDELNAAAFPLISTEADRNSTAYHSGREKQNRKLDPITSTLNSSGHSNKEGESTDEAFKFSTALRSSASQLPDQLAADSSGNTTTRTVTEVEAGVTIDDKLPSGGNWGREIGNFFHALLEGLAFDLATERNNALFEEKLTDLLRTYRGLTSYKNAIRELVKALFEVPLPLLTASQTDSPQVESLQVDSLQGVSRLKKGVFSLKNIAREDCMFEMEFILPTALPEHALMTQLQAIITPSTDHNLTKHSHRNVNHASDSAKQGAYFLCEAGFVRGFIDLWFKYEGRYYLLDWKTNDLERENALAEDERAVPIADLYSRAHLERVMVTHGYRLQYHIYLLALHRHLERTLGAAYRYEEHMGGIIYIFIRGVDKARGVFMERVAKKTLSALEQLFKSPHRVKESVITAEVTEPTVKEYSKKNHWNPPLFM
ncbi:RecBCD enzyme subunit RecB [Spirochaetota bacterium]|nr:RecBCD enzyme subunit RecB [Spirochaetota bacterium]